MDEGGKDIDAQVFRTIKHDIKNHLSTISMVIDELKYEMANAPADQLEYLNMIAQSAIKIDAILKSTE